MLVLRILGGLFVLVIGVALVAHVVTRDRRWLRFAWQTFRLGLVILLIFMALYALERLVLVV
jgi:hypothetical protein